MIAAVKEEVLDKLKSKRLHQTEATGLQKPKATSVRRSVDLSSPGGDGSPKQKNSPTRAPLPKSHQQILDMLEHFERVSPQALNVFLESAKAQGIYKPQDMDSKRGQLSKSVMVNRMQEINDQNNMQFNRRSGAGSLLGRYNKEQRSQYEEIPARFSKLVTFKPAPPQSQRQSPKRSSMHRKSMAKAFLQIEGITDLKRRPANASIKLEKIESQEQKRVQIAEIDQDDDTTNIGDTIQESQQKSMNTQSKRKKYKQNHGLTAGQILPSTFDNSAQDEKMLMQNKTVGAVSFYNQQPLDTIIQRRIQLFSKMPKLAPLVEKNEKFHEFMRRLCNAGSKDGQNLNVQQSQQNQQTQKKEQNESQPSLQQQQTTGLTTNAIKNLRLSKQNIKAHVSKRYGKTISERLMIILESCNKTMHNIEYNAYLELISYCFFSLQNVTVNGQIHALPNMYKMMYQLFDGGNKGFICEHDIFQIIWSLNSGIGNITRNTNKGSEQSNTTQESFQNGINQNTGGGEPKSRGGLFNVGYSSYPDMDSMNISVNYKDNFPRIKRSVYAEAFQQDFNVFMTELEKLRAQSHLQNLRQMNLASAQSPSQQMFGSPDITIQSGSFQEKAGKFTTTDSPHPQMQSVKNALSPDGLNEGAKAPTHLPPLITNKQPLKRATSPPKKSTSFGQSMERKKPVSFFKSIVENISQHNKTAVMLSEDVKGSKSNQQMTQMLNGGQGVSFSANAFSHFNPIYQLIKEKKQYSKAIQDIIKEENCRQITFEQFLRISAFNNDIPQFLDDLFHYLTTISLRELLKKQGNNQSSGSQASIVPRKKSQATEGSSKNMQQHFSGNPFLQMDREELNLMKRQMTFLALQKYFDESDLHRLMKGFQLLAQNGQTEKDVMNMFISQQSILENFKKVFQCFNESLALRFYNVLSHGISFNRIYLPTYLTKIHPLFSNELTDQMHFIFDLFDTDLDGLLNSKDIGDFMKNVLTCPIQHSNDVKNCGCRLFQEFEIMYKDYVHQNILTYRVRKHLIDFEFYLREIQYTCLIEEFIDKLTLMWERPSIFSHDQIDQMHLRDYYQIDRDEVYSKISYINNQGYSNAVEKCVKRLSQFDKNIEEIVAPHFMGHPHHQCQFMNSTSVHSSHSNMLQHNEMHQQQIEEDYASMVLQSHKAAIEITRICNLDQNIIKNSNRSLQAKHLRRIVEGMPSIDTYNEERDGDERGDKSPQFTIFPQQQLQLVPTLNLTVMSEKENSIVSGQ